MLLDWERLILLAFAPILGFCAGSHSIAAESIIDDNPAVPRLAPQAIDGRPIRVAMVDSGVNYLLPVIQQSLARSPEGQLVGYDFWDMDERPFDSHPSKSGIVQRHGTQTASLLIKEAPFVRLVPYRYPRPDMQRMEQLLQHAAVHDVRIMGLALGGNRKEDWAPFESAAKLHPQILIIASAGNNGRDIDKEPVYPASLTIPNLLVVTSADDFVRPARGVNWGRRSVDYMVPAEMQTVIRFDGTEAQVSGSSYAVPRVVALAARLLKHNPSLDTQALIANIRAKFANGVVPRQIGQGYIHDPQFDAQASFNVESVLQWQASDVSMPAGDRIREMLPLPLNVYVLDERWGDESVQAVLGEAQAILSQCDIVFDKVVIKRLNVEGYLKVLETGRSKTLMETIGRSGPNRNVAVFFVQDTVMNEPFDAEAFGRGNTRSRPWLTETVWLTWVLRDRGIALAHELFHILVNSGQHSTMAGNLMLARTTGDNRKLETGQCEPVRQRVVDF
jgi:hypothetical protein